MTDPIRIKAKKQVKLPIYVGLSAVISSDVLEPIDTLVRMENMARGEVFVAPFSVRKITTISELDRFLETHSDLLESFVQNDTKTA